MTFYSKEHPLAKYCILWTLKARPWMGEVFNFFEVIHKSSVAFFQVSLEFEVPFKKTFLRGDDNCLEIRWSVQEYDDLDALGNSRLLTFVGWESAMFVEKGEHPISFTREIARDWIALYDLVFRLFRTSKPPPKNAPVNLYDTRLNILNIILNTIRLEMMFGQGKEPCRVCQENFGMKELCDDCVHACSDEEEFSPSE